MVPVGVGAINFSSEGRTHVIKLVLGATVVAFGALSASAAFAQMAVTSAEIAEGSVVKMDQVANTLAAKAAIFLRP
jgi:hypothetical protein